ncbi:gamma interferon inducible lysosomal thiol reductase (GILT) domain-containing protein [Hirsutella rhossiliensis]|uniref:Gamma interferon inducible lysosomal thiol reductase (GILT) domain-containing protein n=1 Tax=Hirsutella rhossiliensis TaxID=111463 RepID=A0A9P8N006_9HYPO|nr:gamma interferon inducible lysosomal thiol reductase (GILT) domain-containing protein [Hirsutella rhossiliensis]KAH0965618.1 gamma interferon inducible lysosomal thiol reductase (GILT) domain-containing protein [Hirsutella rhossiliensis]
MDDKATTNSNILHPNAAMPTRTRPVVRLLLLLVFIVAVGFYTVARPFAWHPSFAPVADGGALKKSGLVPLEAHIISKCPDTRDALRQLILPAMQQVHDKVDFKLNYIGTPTANDGIECKHGPSECLGNIIELCARELYPDPKINLGFIMCLTKDYQEIPNRALIEDCALEHAIDFKALNECATRDDGAHGLELLRTSVLRTAAVNVTISCTLRLNNEVYCIRDGGEWKDCPHGSGVNDLVVAIEKLHRSSS